MASQDGDGDEVSLELLRRAVLNEISSPELLPFQHQITEHFFTQLAERNDIGDSVQTLQEKKIANIFSLDCERVKYYLQLYLRCRLLKIDKYHSLLLANESTDPKLSESELKYANQYKKILHRHFLDSFLIEIPERLRGVEEVKTDVNMEHAADHNKLRHSVPEPVLDSPVFCRVIKDIGDVIFERGNFDNLFQQCGC